MCTLAQVHVLNTYGCKISIPVYKFFFLLQFLLFCYRWNLSCLFVFFYSFCAYANHIKDVKCNNCKIVSHFELCRIKLYNFITIFLSISFSFLFHLHNGGLSTFYTDNKFEIYPTTAKKKKNEAIFIPFHFFIASLCLKEMRAK